MQGRRVGAAGTLEGTEGGPEHGANRARKGVEGAFNLVGTQIEIRAIIRRRLLPLASAI